MGDHRASIKIEFEMHGVKTTKELWINWWEGACNELPSALRDVLREAEDASMSAWYEERGKAETEMAKQRRLLADQARAKLTPEEIAALLGEDGGKEWHSHFPST